VKTRDEDVCLIGLSQDDSPVIVVYKDIIKLKEKQ